MVETTMTEQERVLAGGGEMGALMRSMDWSQTHLGPVESWPPALRAAVSVMLAAPYPVVLYWGPELYVLYNDGVIPLIGGKHPAALGVAAREVFAEVWDVAGPLFEEVERTQTAVHLENQPLFMNRQGFVEEAYFTWSYVPMRDEHGHLVGIFCSVNETTLQMFGERRFKCLRELSIRTALAQDTLGVMREAGETLAHHGHDVPFALLYRVEGDTARLVLRSGLEQDSILAPGALGLAEAASPWPLAEVLCSGQERVVEDLGARGLQAGPWPEPVQRALLLPLALGGGALDSVLVVGLSPRLPLDESYRDFLQLLARQLAADVARAHALEQEKQRGAQLAELDRVKTAFFSNVSHEFRTPLTLILGPLEAALTSPAQSLQGDSLERVHGNAQRLLRLVNALLEFSRVEAGRAALRLQPTDLARTTAGLAHAFDSVVVPAGLALNVDCPPLPRPVWVDPELWEKVVLNLISNAFKFTHAGHIAVRQRWTGDGIELRVEDSGTGIPSAALPRLFERFHRVEGAKGRSIEGSGIGLSLVKSLVELHGGRIQVESTPGVGSAFTVTLPATPPGGTEEEVTGQTAMSEAPQATAAAFVREASQWVTETATATARPLGTTVAAAAREGRVLLVDDNADMRRYVADLLAPRFDVETRVDGMSALEAARAAPPDVVVSDLMMPGMDGFALARALRAEEGTRAVPVILCSARADEDAKVEALGAGATDYLVKPVGARELLARVDAAVKVGRAAAARLKEQDRLRAILDQAPAAICLLDGPEHRFTMANARYLELAGGRDVLGKTVAEMLPEAVEQGFVALMDTVYRTGAPHLGIETWMELESADGSGRREACLNFIYQPVKDAAGQTQFIFVHAVDVTEIVRAREHEAALAREAAIRASFEQQLIGLVSHDLRNPLGAIGFGAAMLLQNKSLDPRVARTVTRIQSSTERAQRMVSDLLDFTQVRLGGGLPMNPRPLDLAPFLRQLCEEVQTNHRDRLIVVHDEGPCPGEVDSDRVAQVVVNLLSNALKYGDHAVPVTVRLEDLGRSVRLRVHNGGKPIPPDVKARLFEPMQRGSTVMEAGGRSVGLGLYITQHIVQAHGGTIGVTSTEAEGTTFTVMLPRRARVTDGQASATN